MSIIKYYDTNTNSWLPAVVGQQGETGATGATGPAGIVYGPTEPPSPGASGYLWLDVDDDGSTFEIAVNYDSSIITNAVTSFDFVGNGVNVTSNGSAVTVTIEGGGSGSGSEISNGNSNVKILENGNVFTSVSGISNVFIVTNLGANISGDFDITGNLVAATITETSSIVLKENISPITNAIDKIQKLSGVTYDRKDNNAKNEAGLILEEFIHVLPNLVGYDRYGKPTGINYSKLTAYLIEAIKELKAEIENLKNKTGSR